MHAHVTKILIDQHTGVAYGVKFKRNGKMWIVHARKEIVLSAGMAKFLSKFELLVRLKKHIEIAL